MRDLEIRGAGSLFGDVQSGHFGEVGYEMYTKLLEENIKELKGEKVEEEIETTVDILVDAYIPNTYIEKQKYKMDIYQEIIYCKENEELKIIIKELMDRYRRFSSSA